MDLFTYSALIITGFAACAEFGSFAFVHPVIKKLPPEYHIQVEKGLVKTFGRVMPVLMTLCQVIGISYTVKVWSIGGAVQWLALLAAICFGIAITSTTIFNVPRNATVSQWDAGHLPKDWKKQRNIWELFQGIRASLLLVGFFLLAAAIVWQVK